MSTTMNLSTMTIERLTDLMAAVGEIPPHHLDLGQWECGSHCCAAGGYERKFPGRIEGVIRGDEWFPKHGFRSVSDHFILSLAQIFFIFDSSEYERSTGSLARAAVLNRVRLFIEHDGDIEAVKAAEQTTA